MQSGSPVFSPSAWVYTKGLVPAVVAFALQGLACSHSTYVLGQRIKKKKFWFQLLRWRESGQGSGEQRRLQGPSFATKGTKGDEDEIRREVHVTFPVIVSPHLTLYFCDTVC